MMERVLLLYLNELCPVIFDPTILPKRVDKSDGKDIVRSSACNYYDGVSQHEVEEFYAKLKKMVQQMKLHPMD